MKSPSGHLPSKPRGRASSAQAFTLVEMMATVAIFLLVVLALVGLQIFAFKMTALTASTLSSLAYSLKSLSQIRDQVCGAYAVQVGNVIGGTWTPTNNSGTLRIYPTTNLSQYLEVYLNTNNATLYLSNNSNNSQFPLASNLANQLPFQTVDYQGNAWSNPQDHYAIEMTLQFSQLAYTVPTNTYVLYTLQTTMTPRAQN